MSTHQCPLGFFHTTTSMVDRQCLVKEEISSKFSGILLIPVITTKVSRTVSVNALHIKAWRSRRLNHPFLNLEFTKRIQYDLRWVAELINSTGKSLQERGEEESAGRAEWVVTSVRGDLWDKDSSKCEREGLQDGSQTCSDVWFRDG